MHFGARAIVLLTVCSSWVGVAHADLSLVVYPQTRTLTVLGSDAGTATLDNGAGAIGWVSDIGPPQCTVDVSSLFQASPVSLTGASLTVGVGGEISLLLTHDLPLELLTLSGAETLVSYAALDTQCQQVLESLHGASIPTDPTRGTGFSPLGVLVVNNDPGPAMGPVGLAILTVLLGVTAVLALRARRNRSSEVNA